MNTKTKILLSALPLLAPVAAQTANNVSLDTIAVTATRRSLNAQKVPGTLTVITPKIIESEHLDSAVDVPKFSANATGWNMDGRDRPRYYIRGIGNGNVADNATGAVAVYIDDVYQNSLLLQGFPIFDESRVEILNGPQGTLWGKNATAGALNFISAPPSFNREGWITAEVGDYGQRRGEFVINGPLLGDQLAGRLSVRYENSDGWTTDRITGKHSGDYGDFAARGQILDRIADGDDILLSVHGRDFLGTRSPYFVYAASSVNVPLQVGSNAYSSNNIDNRQKTNEFGGSARVRWKLPAGISLTSIAAFEQANRNDYTDGDSTPQGYSQTYVLTRPTQESEELRLASDAAQRISWIGGIYLFHEHLSDFTTTATLPPGVTTTPAILGQPAFVSALYDQGTYSEAVFGNTTINVNDQFSISGGLRFTYDQMSINYFGLQGTGNVTFSNLAQWWLPQSVSSNVADVAPFHETRNWKKLSWEAEPQYKITPDDLIYARVSTGYRAGNFNTQLTANTTNRGAAPLGGPGVVNPETLTSYEGGYKGNWFAHKLELTADGFYGDYKNIQVSWTALNAATKTTVISLTNAASGVSYGAEASFRARPVPQLTLNGNFGLLETRFTSFIGPSSASLTGNQFARAPHLTGNLGADYTFEPSWGDVTVGSSWQYISHYYYLVSNEKSESYQQNSYSLADLHLSFIPANSNLEFGAIINNLTNTVYKTQVPPYSATTGYFTYQLGAPRTFLISAKYRFF